MKATLELALLGHYWAIVKPGDERFSEATALIQEIWRRAEFSQRIAADPLRASLYSLLYVALTPAGTADRSCQPIFAQVASDNQTRSSEESAYLLLETRHFLDMAAVEHQIKSYEELYESTLLARLPSALHVADVDAYIIAHTIFYLSDFGLRRSALARAERDRATRIVYKLLGHYVRLDNWDLASVLMLAHFCLGGDTIHTPIGQAAARGLVQAQLANGAIPGPSSARKMGDPATAAELFRMNYHTTLVAALASLIVSSALPSHS